MKKDLFKFPLNIQTFSDDGGNNGGGNNGDGTYDIEKDPRYIKLKEANDKNSSELAKFKKEQKEKLPELEQLKQDLENERKARASAEAEILNAKITTEFVNAGFGEEDVKTLLEKRATENPLDFIQAICSLHKKQIEKVRADEAQKFQGSTTYPPANEKGNNGNSGNAFMDNVIKQNKNAYGTPLDRMNKK